MLAPGLSTTADRISKKAFQRSDGDRLTGDFRIVSKIAFNIGPMRGRGGVTPHMRTRSMRALDRSSSLSLTEEENLRYATVKTSRNTFGKTK
jgi:hypothetical protein